MMWARFPNGQVVQYNDANFLSYKSSAWELYTKEQDKGGRWVCSIPYSAGCIVEVIKACYTENPLDHNWDHQRVANDLAHTAKQLRLTIKDLTKKK